jgi:sorting nexin-8
LEDPAIDPWAAPATAKPQTQPVHNSASSNGPTAAIPISTGNSNHPRTTSAFTTNSEDPGLDDAAGARPADGWGSYGNTGAGFAGDGAAGFGSGNDDVPIPRPPRHVGGGRTTSRGVEETVTITLLPDKEGMFMFQHRNYEVKSARRASTVVRRYSDFVWLLDCLHKRYPFRQLPLLPPKRVAGK